MNVTLLPSRSVRTRSLGSALLAFAFLLGGCASDSYQRVPIPEPAAAIPAYHARVFVVRDDQVVGRDRHVDVLASGRSIGRLGPASFLCWDQRAGDVVLQLIFDRPAPDGGGIEGLSRLTLTAGETAYVRISLQSAPELSSEKAAVGMPTAERLSEAEGRAIVDSSAPAPFDGSR
ncbi:MAG: hypothetical protein AAF726_04135 [Planctomycetota bacterium]